MHGLRSTEWKVSNSLSSEKSTPEENESCPSSQTSNPKVFDRGHTYLAKLVLQVQARRHGGKAENDGGHGDEASHHKRTSPESCRKVEPSETPQARLQ